jgi:hypothetical protein
VLLERLHKTVKRLVTKTRSETMRAQFCTLQRSCDEVVVTVQPDIDRVIRNPEVSVSAARQEGLAPGRFHL